MPEHFLEMNGIRIQSTDEELVQERNILMMLPLNNLKVRRGVSE